nr:PREDICTED: toll-like receptor 3 [Latimeria chalumnae]|eukprot:XP_006006842.2 PREDICTED: toll-like receptor 3 [Latimeria chalumnae]
MLNFLLILLKNDVSQPGGKRLSVLDISRNTLTSAKLGSEQQLQNLWSLVLSANKIKVLKKDDLSFLSNTFLKQLDLSLNPLNQFEPGCLHGVGTLGELIMDNSSLSANLTERLCLELSGTEIKSLSLSNNRLSKILNITFRGLQETNLTTLILSQNGLSEIENGSFTWLHNLTHLILEDNRIAHVKTGTFFGLSNLRYLSLKKSLRAKLGSKYEKAHIDDLSFQWLNLLEHLNMEENIFSAITTNTFIGLKSLMDLSLCHSSSDLKVITNATFSSLAMSPLAFLNLSSTGISKLESGAFNWFKVLKKLYIGFNEISQTLSGYEFKGLDHIEEIYLSNNKRLTLTSFSFHYVPTLTILMLGKTQVANLNINPSPFQPLQNLRILDLSNNNLAKINDDLFSALKNLEILKMQHNNLARLWKHVNPGGPVLFLRGLQNLQVLRLDFNGFDEIPVNGFKGLSQLMDLNLGSNDLNVLPKGVFSDLTSLRTLELQKNLITFIDEEVFHPVFVNLAALYMGFNPFDCTCESISWFVSWLNVTNTSIPGLEFQYICNTPQKFYNTSVMLFDTSPCAPFIILFKISTSFILIFLFAVVFIQFQGWRIEFYWNIAVNRVLGYKEIDRLEVQYQYDAYIIHAEKDIGWVNRNIVPLEENDQTTFHFCLEERDFEAGACKLEAIVNGIRRSKKIVFVVTRKLLEDPWCKRFKVHHAVQQAIEQSHDSIILVFLEDIPDYKLNHALCLRRGMFKSRCILSWPAQRERVNAFHQKFKVALGSSNREH